MAALPHLVNQGADTHMPNAVEEANQEMKRAPNWSIAAFVMVIVMVANTALIFSLLQMLTWAQCAVVVFTGVSITGGVVFTIVTMQRLGRS
jgi:hypothetical protein